MPDAAISDEVTHLLRECVDSFEKLDVLLLLLRKARALGGTEIAETLKLSPEETHAILAALVAGGLVVELARDSWIYRPAAAAQADAAAALARLFEDDPVRVVLWMSRNSIERLRSSTASAFMDALRAKHAKKREP